jgi:hypothetical protein
MQTGMNGGKKGKGTVWVERGSEVKDLASKVMA